MLLPADIGESSILPALAELDVFKKDGHYLCLNSSGPSWMVTNELGALLLSLCDGRRAVRDIHAAFGEAGLAPNRDLVVNFYREAVGQGVFLDPAVGGGRSRSAAQVSAVHLHLTNKCNLACSYCYRHSDPHVPIRRSAEDFIDWLEKLRPRAAEGCEITFAGGEPLVFPGFARVAAATKVLGYDNFLLTNGILLRRHSLDFYRDTIDQIRVSLDGGDELTHSRTRGAGHFEKVVANILWLTEGQIVPDVQMTLTRANLASAALLKERLPSKIKIRYTPMFPMGRADREAAATRPEDFITPAEFYVFRTGLLEDQEKPKFQLRQEGSRNTGCFAGRENISVDDNGDVYPCHLFHYPQFKIGNVFESDVCELMTGAKNMSFVEDMHVDRNNDFCAACAVRYLCGGGCKANALHESGDFHGRDSLCTYLKAEVVSDLFLGYGL